VELAQWLLQSERNLRAGAPQTQTTLSGQNNFAGTMLPAMATSMPAIVQAVNTPQTQPTTQIPYYQSNQGQTVGNNATYNYGPGIWGAY